LGGSRPVEELALAAAPSKQSSFLMPNPERLPWLFAYSADRFDESQSQFQQSRSQLASGVGAVDIQDRINEFNQDQHSSMEV